MPDIGIMFDVIQSLKPFLCIIYPQSIMPHICVMTRIDFFSKEKIGQKRPIRFIKKDLSLSVSRVLSCTVIYLGLSSPISSSDIHGISSDGQPYVTNTQSCSEWGLHGRPRYRGIGELLPRLSILTANGRPKIIKAKS